MAYANASKALPAPSLDPLATPTQERRNQVVSELVTEDTRRDPDAVEALFDLATNETIRQLLALNKPPSAISNSYCSWLADKMVWTRFVPHEPFPFEEPQLSPGLFLQPSAEYTAALLGQRSNQRELMLQAAPGSTSEPNPKWWRGKFGSPAHRMKLPKDLVHRDSWPAITKTRHLSINSPFGLTLHSSLWNNNVGQLKRILPGSQTLPAVLCPWGRGSLLRLEVTSSALARGFLDLVLLLDKEPAKPVSSGVAEQFVLGYMLLLKWYLHIFCQAPRAHPAGVNLYGAIAYQRQKTLGHPRDEAYSWVDNQLDLKTGTTYSTSEISKQTTFEEAKAALYKAADSHSMSGIKREHALLRLHETWERRGSFLHRLEIEKEHDRLVTDYLLPDVVSNLDNFFGIDDMPERMREWAVANPFNIKRIDSERLYELMWRTWMQRSVFRVEKHKKILFMYQAQHARKMYREHLAELKLRGKGVEQLKEFARENNARFHLSEELRLQLALDEYEKQLKASTLDVCPKKGGKRSWLPRMTSRRKLRALVFIVGLLIRSEKVYLRPGRWKEGRDGKD
ncbi:hypothetical protein QBC32DRAFT_401099 [Pseudoneurospora amorphoporcata]|uniref:Uncharacterized protein n=1 Tax=Pseudoneurospora amorphoporcata TaxID=241081 RepID=A0AAN6NNM0_9PEZI|nr:hypothetical protein QBC32DRAFT_401099 [Pseudoneurospora amorphoporcata]